MMQKYLREFYLTVTSAKSVENAKFRFTLKRGGRVKLRKYLMIIQNVKNEWSSDLALILTDDKEEYENELKKFKEMA